MYLDKRLNVGSLSSPSHMLWQTILRYWIAKILQAMLKEVRERRGEERKGDVKQMLLDCSKFHGVGWKAQYDSAQVISTFNCIFGSIWDHKSPCIAL